MAAPSRPKPLLTTVDTNVLLDLAEDNESVWDAIETIRRRLKGSQIVVLPTVKRCSGYMVRWARKSDPPSAIYGGGSLTESWV